jgi:hypothetical protein
MMHDACEDSSECTRPTEQQRKISPPQAPNPFVILKLTETAFLWQRRRNEGDLGTVARLQP